MLASPIHVIARKIDGEIKKIKLLTFRNTGCYILFAFYFNIAILDVIKFLVRVYNDCYQINCDTTTKTAINVECCRIVLEIRARRLKNV